MKSEIQIELEIQEELKAFDKLFDEMIKNNKRVSSFKVSKSLFEKVFKRLVKFELVDTESRSIALSCDGFQRRCNNGFMFIMIKTQKYIFEWSPDLLGDDKFEVSIDKEVQNKNVWRQPAYITGEEAKILFGLNPPLNPASNTESNIDNT
jgi:hypothetical protein